MAAEGADRTLRVDPAVMAGIAQSLAGAAEHLQTRLKELDGQVGEMLGGWQGASGTAYGSAWERWHEGAAEVESALSILAKLIGQAGVCYGHNETVSADELGAVGRG